MDGFSLRTRGNTLAPIILVRLEDRRIPATGPSTPPNRGNSELQTIDLIVSQPTVFTTDSTGPQQPKKRRGAITEEILY
jgi:hypothetical protein